MTIAHSGATCVCSGTLAWRAAPRRRSTRRPCSQRVHHSSRKLVGADVLGSATWPLIVILNDVLPMAREVRSDDGFVH